VIGRPERRNVEISLRAGWASEYAISANGTLVYNPSDSGTRTLRLIDRAGRERSIGLGDSLYGSPRWSPDGRRVSFLDVEALWIYDLERSSKVRVPLAGGPTGNALLSPDGTKVAYYSERAGGTVWQPVDRDTVFPVPGGKGLVPTSWSADGKTLIATTTGLGSDIAALSFDGSAPPRRFTRSSAYDDCGTLSPDGRWLAYCSARSGRFEVYVKSFHDPALEWQVSTDGGEEPAWSSDGRQLYFNRGDRLISVAIVPGATFRTGAQQALFPMAFGGGCPQTSYDVHPNGQQFVVGYQTVPARLIVVRNWLAEWDGRTPQLAAK
jgi:Tol biopolymer transport system component